MMRGGGGGRGRGGGSAACREECRTSCGVIHPPVSVNSFFKVLIGPDFSDLLYIPPKFAPEVSTLVGQKVVLEDSRGNRWRVKLTEHRGSLVLRKGWRNFLSDHDLEIGDFLVFHYLGSHFLVKIYDKSACEKIEFRGSPAATSSRKGSKVSECTLTGNRCSDAVKRGRSRPLSKTVVEFEDEVVFVANRDEAKEDNRTVVNLSVSEMQVDNSDYQGGQCFVEKEPNSCDQASTTGTPSGGARAKLATDITSDDREEILDIDPLAIAVSNTHAFTMSFAGTPTFADNALGERSTIKKRGRPRKNRSTASIKSVTSRFENLLCDEPVSETEPRQIDNSTVLTLMDVPSPIPQETNISLKVTVANTCYLELPVNLLSVLPKSRGVKKSKEGRIIILEDHLKRWWPVLYREEQVKFLSTGWKCFSEANHISPGDECLLVTRGLNKAILGVSILHDAGRT